MGDKEEVWDSWEDMADSGVLDKELEEAKKKQERQTQPQINPVPFLQEDSQRTAYQPQLKILKRPSDAGGDQNSTAEIKDVNKTKPKTLAEREEEYKQARLRILGSAETDFTPSEPIARPSIENRPKERNSSAGGSKR